MLLSVEPNSYLFLYVKLNAAATTCTFIDCRIDCLDLLVDEPRVGVHSIEFCKGCHLHLFFQSPLGQGGIYYALTCFLYAAVSI